MQRENYFIDFIQYLSCICKSEYINDIIIKFNECKEYDLIILSGLISKYYNVDNYIIKYLNDYDIYGDIKKLFSKSILTVEDIINNKPFDDNFYTNELIKYCIKICHLNFTHLTIDNNNIYSGFMKSEFYKLCSLRNGYYFLQSIDLLEHVIKEINNYCCELQYRLSNYNNKTEAIKIFKKENKNKELINISNNILINIYNSFLIDYLNKPINENILINKVYNDFY